jgi:hypothetical protein
MYFAEQSPAAPAPITAMRFLIMQKLPNHITALV